MSKRILIAGESWSSTTIHTKGFDSFITTSYNEGVEWLQRAFESIGDKVVFMPNHVAANNFPTTLDELQTYDVVLLSDIGVNTLLLPSTVFVQGQRIPNRCDIIKEYVLAGGGLVMVGGYLTFTGIDAKGRWGTTAVADVLPVNLLEVDDRRENPQGVVPGIVSVDHPIFKGIPAQWPHFLGYNKTVSNSHGTVLATIGEGDPFVVVGEFGKGRSAVFTSDCSPHWAPMEFCNWEYYAPFWCNLAAWLAKEL
jgi:uncharacterized membrane protein